MAPHPIDTAADRLREAVLDANEAGDGPRTEILQRSLDRLEDICAMPALRAAPIKALIASLDAERAAAERASDTADANACLAARFGECDEAARMTGRAVWLNDLAAEIDGVVAALKAVRTVV